MATGSFVTVCQYAHMAGPLQNPGVGTRVSASTYRRDIDGLRGVAVLAVVLFHLGVPGFAGGLAGVDVFFVVSGFLITRILTAELAAGDFSVARFYARRVRRIFP